MKIGIFFIMALNISNAADSPKNSQERYDKLMALWYDMSPIERKDNFFTHIKKANSEKSDEGSSITEKEYNELIALSKKENIPEYIEYDSAGRPPLDLRSGLALEACEKLSGQPNKRCEKKFKEIVDNQSDQGDEISDAEWDAFQTLLKSIKGKK